MNKGINFFQVDNSGNIVTTQNTSRQTIDIANIFFVENYIEALTKGRNKMPTPNDPFWGDAEKMSNAAKQCGLPSSLLDSPSEDIEYSYIYFTNPYEDTNFKVIEKIDRKEKGRVKEKYFIFDKNRVFQRELKGRIAQTVREEAGATTNFTKKNILPIISDDSLVVYNKNGEIIFEKIAENVGIDYDNEGNFTARRKNGDTIYVYDSQTSKTSSYSCKLEKADLEYPRQEQEGYLLCYGENNDLQYAVSSGDLADLTLIYKNKK